MNANNQTKHSVNSSLWALEKKLGIPIWYNSLSLPECTFQYKPSELILQEKVNFVFVPSADKQKSLYQFFISEKTDFLMFFKLFPFFSSNTKCYLCSDLLISERIAMLKQNTVVSAENAATKLLVKVLHTAISSGASDIHLESQPGKKSIRMRINGSLNAISFEEEINETIFSKIKLVSRMDIANQRSPQDGHFPFTTDKGQRFDVRTSSIPSVYGEKIVLRLLPAKTVKFSMEKLGFLEEHIPIIQNQISKKSGMILFTGPTGSGKTTSLYAILNELLLEPINIVTVEDPVEYRLEGITQVQVNEMAGVSFSDALRAILRQDPDVILIGEIRDTETAQIAARAAQTGHLVLSTLHSNDSFETIRRLQNLGVANDDIASSLRLVISQRLIQESCECKNEHDCMKCRGTGKLGRIPLMEILEISSEIIDLISSNKPVHEIRSKVVDSSFMSLKKVGDRLLKLGKTTKKEIDAISIY